MPYCRQFCPKVTKEGPGTKAEAANFSKLHWSYFSLPLCALRVQGKWERAGERVECSASPLLQDPGARNQWVDGVCVWWGHPVWTLTCKVFPGAAPLCLSCLQCELILLGVVARNPNYCLRAQTLQVEGPVRAFEGDSEFCMRKSREIWWNAGHVEVGRASLARGGIPTSLPCLPTYLLLCSDRWLVLNTDHFILGPDLGPKLCFIILVFAFSVTLDVLQRRTWAIYKRSD